VALGYRSSRSPASNVVAELECRGPAGSRGPARRHRSGLGRRRGAIVNFSSTYGNGITPDNAINFVPVTYSTAKAAIRGFTATLARDLAPDIRANALAPGPITGEWEAEWGVLPEHIDEAIAMNPLKRFGMPEEIAETVLFLASDGAGYITGGVIHVDGGWVVAG
jgi:3-oxoacyl-[acyl-carrier protein] reductase